MRVNLLVITTHSHFYWKCPNGNSKETTHKLFLWVYITYFQAVQTQFCFNIRRFKKLQSINQYIYTHTLI